MVEADAILAPSPSLEADEALETDAAPAEEPAREPAFEIPAPPPASPVEQLVGWADAIVTATPAHRGALLEAVLPPPAPSPARVFDAFSRGGQSVEDYQAVFEVVAMPGTRPGALQAGDFVLQRPLDGGPGRAAIVARETYRPAGTASYVETIGTWPVPHTSAHGLSELLTDADGILPVDMIVLRPLALRESFAAPIETVSLGDWRYLISFRPSRTVQTTLRSRGRIFAWTVHHLEAAWGDINLDYYPVSVTALPSGHATPQELLRYIRTNLNSFVDTRICEFHPYDARLDGPLWTSTWPMGTVIHIAMKVLGGRLNPDDGSVVVSEYDPQHWIFSTCWTEGDLSHPVSGNRQFGFIDHDGGGWTFYTRGADRLTQLVDYAAGALAFSSADALWRSLQTGITDFVNSHGGRAVVEPSHSARYPWPSVRSAYWAPTTGWY